MTPRYDLVALGGGTGGLVSAAGAAYLGLSSAIVERTALGGDCLWTGCVPSKALIAAARAAHGAAEASRLGVGVAPPEPSFASVMEWVRSARGTVAHHDDPERFRAMGVDVHFGEARFVDGSTIDVDGVGPIRAKRVFIATGAVPSVPSIPGLEESGYWTYETVFDQRCLPARLLVLGGGPIGLEFAQTFQRLGARVTVLEIADRVLLEEDPDVSTFVTARLRDEGVAVHTGVTATAVTSDDSGATIETSDGQRFRGDRIFVACGRRANTEGLNLEAAGVETRNGSIVVDPFLRTTAKGIWAVGDVTGGLQFTHAAEHMARTALQNSLLPIKRKISYDNVPRVTFTDPEVAHVGLSESDARARGARVYRYEMSDLDRAIVDGADYGFVKISADPKGRILGATIVARSAGELLQPLVLAKQNGLTLGKVAGTVFPYPTLTEGVKRASNEFMRGRLDTASGRAFKRVVQWLK